MFCHILLLSVSIHVSDTILTWHSDHLIRMKTVQENKIWAYVSEVACVKAPKEIKGSFISCDSVSEISAFLKLQLSPETRLIIAFRVR